MSLEYEQVARERRSRIESWFRKAEEGAQGLLQQLPTWGIGIINHRTPKSLHRDSQSRDKAGILDNLGNSNRFAKYHF